jgi:acyl-CoA thioesterase
MPNARIAPAVRAFGIPASKVASAVRAKHRAMSEDDALATRVADAMYERDRASKSMGMTILEVRAGFARLAMSVRDDMVNGHDLCHGGFIFTLVDSAFAYACNSRNDSTVALQCSISFSASARLGERLIATAQERVLGGRTGTYDGEVRREDGSVVALFRGTSYRVKGSVI